MRSLPRLYPILDVDAAKARGLRPLDLAEIWLDAGVELLQVRAKVMSGRDWLELARRLVERARQTGARVIVNDRADVARLAGAAGVHVGQDDLTPVQVRGLLGPDAIVGLSTHTDAQVERALAEPVNYLAIGPVFVTGSKAVPDPAVGEEGVRRAAGRARPWGMPVVAIGGITLERAPGVIAAGASSVAVISDLLEDDPAVRIRRFLAALTL